MSEETGGVDLEVETPHIHHRTGHRGIDLIVPIAALFVSFLSILIAWHHGQVMQQLVSENAKLVRANSLPYLQLFQSTNTPDGERRLALAVTNQGVGPGEIRSAEVLVDGRPHPDIRSALTACCGSAGAYDQLLTSSLTGRMLRPGEMSEFVVLPVKPATQVAADRVLDALEHKRIEARLCFCSVFDECWAVSNLGKSKPTPVAQCRPVKVMYNQ